MRVVLIEFPLWYNRAPESGRVAVVVCPDLFALVAGRVLRKTREGNVNNNTFILP